VCRLSAPRNLYVWTEHGCDHEIERGSSRAGGSLRESYLLERLSRAVAAHPRLVLGLVGVVSLALASQLPKLKADPSPRALLVSADSAQQQLEDEERALFGSANNTVLVVVSSNDALDRRSLAFVHRLAGALARFPHVERVDALTRIPWPKRKQEEATLDDLRAQDSSESPEQLNAASDLVASAPDVFPLGLVSLAEKTADRRIEPLVSGDEVSDQDVALIREALGKAGQLEGRLVSRDHKHLMVAAQFSDTLVKHTEMAKLVDGIEAWLGQHPPPHGSEVLLSGLPVIRTSLVRHMRADQRVLIPGTLLASFIVLALSFRWAPAVVLPLLAVGVTALWLLSGMALFGEPLNVLNNMLPALVIIIGLNEAVHIIGRYREECRSDADRPRALGATVRAMGAACLTTTATSALGMLALMVSRTEMLRRFGIVGAAGLFLAYAVTLLIVPSVLSLLRAPPAARETARERRGPIERLLSRATSAALRRPWSVLGLAALSAVVAGMSTQRLVVDSTLLDQFSKGDPVYRAVRLIEAEFEGVRPLEITLTSERPGGLFEPRVLEAMRRIRDWSSAQPGVLRASDPSELLLAGWAALAARPEDVAELRSSGQVRALAQLLSARDPRILGRLLTHDGKSARISVRLADIGSHRTGLFVERAKRKLASELRGFDDVHTTFGGDAYLGSRGLDLVVADLSGSVLLAALMIFLLLSVLLRDLRLALLAVPANLLPQIWTMGWMVLRDIPLNASSAIIFSLSIGLAVDGSIHLVSRFQEERARGILTTSAIVRAVRGSGRNIVISSCALGLGFSVMLLSNFVPVRRFAELISVSMAASVFATLVIQPVLLRVFLARKSLAIVGTTRPA
jgi:predicted RND superfamily exporter protein